MSYKLYNHEIKEVSYEDLRPFRSKATKQGIVMDKNTSYLAMHVEGMIVAFVGYMEVKGSVRLKSGWTLPEWRGMGIFQTILDKLIDTHRHREISAFCNKNSLQHLKDRGFLVAGHEGKITYVKLSPKVKV